MSFQSFKHNSFFQRLAALSLLSTILLIARFQSWQSEKVLSTHHVDDQQYASLQDHFASMDEIAISGKSRAVYHRLEKKYDQGEEKQHVFTSTTNPQRRPVPEDKVFKMDSDTENLEPITPSTRYLTYTPHSGFHNQRIALANALQLASRLNRTLLVPPVMLGEPMHWREADVLEDWHRHLSKARHARCKRLSSATSELSSRCKKSSRYTSLRWDRLFDLRALKDRISIQYRDDYEPAYLERHFALTDSDIYKIKDTALYDYRLSDTPGHALGKYRREAMLDDLRKRPEKLIQFGSLFGSGRVMTSTAPSRELKHFIHAQFVFSYDALPDLFAVADTIIGQLGGPGRFLSVHARVGDSIFERFSGKVMGKLWDDLQKHVPKNKTEQTTAPMSVEACLNAIQRNDLKNNDVLFMATDAPQPRTLPLFQSIFETFPCVITLEDVFDYTQSPLTAFVNPEDGVAYGRFLVPFLDGLIASRGHKFTGSMWSTFSGYIQFLHKEYKRNATLTNTPSYPV